MKHSNLKAVVRFIHEILAQLALPFEVLTHHTFGVRYLTIYNAISLGGFWVFLGSLLSWLLSIFGIGNPALIYLYAMFITSVGVYHARKALNKEKKGEWIHTYAAGTSWLFHGFIEPLGVGLLQYKRFIEPLICLLLAVLLYFIGRAFPAITILAGFYGLAALAIAIKAEMYYRHALNRIRDERDEAIEAKTEQAVAQISERQLAKVRRDQTYESEGYEMVVPDFVPVYRDPTLPNV